MPETFDVIPRLLNAQGKAYPRGDGIPKTLAKPQDFCGLEMFLATGDQKERLSAGTTVVTHLDYEISSTGFGPKRPAADHRTGGGGEIVPMQTTLTEYEWASQYTWHEAHLQGDSIFSPEGSQRFWSIMKKREKDFTLDALLKMEQAIFAKPTKSMFTTAETGTMDMKSVWTYVNLWESKHDTANNTTRNGLFPGMTSQQGLDPADVRFRRKDSYGKEQGWSLLEPTKIGYGTAGDDSTDSGDHLFEKMKFMMRIMKWNPVPLAGEFADGVMPSPKYILASIEALELWDRTNRAHGEFFATMNPIGDPGKITPRMNGFLIQQSEAIRDAAIYPDVQGYTGAAPNSEGDAVDRAPVTERSAAGTPGGYFYFFDAENLNIWMQRDRAWQIGQWRSMGPQNEDVFRRLGKSIMNTHCESFATQGILYPTKPIAGYAA